MDATDEEARTEVERSPESYQQPVNANERTECPAQRNPPGYVQKREIVD